ncbi:MAG: cytochrome c4 [Pseudomonadota bacterium]|nr:cytochrome c4 [Pseudomonadota bacterium]
MKAIRIALASLALAIIGSAHAEGDPAKGQATASQICAACHMPDGNSMVPQNPKLAGQHADYISKQLAAFKAGERKNPIMMGMAGALSPEDMSNVGAWFASQKPAVLGAKDKALAEAGQQLYRGGKLSAGVPACAGCHSPSGAGIPAQYPRLAGQYPEYVLAQLKAFRAGERANGNAAQMVAIAARLSDKDMEAVAEYVAGLQ